MFTRELFCEGYNWIQTRRCSTTCNSSADIASASPPKCSRRQFILSPSHCLKLKNNWRTEKKKNPRIVKFHIFFASPLRLSFFFRSGAGRCRDYRACDSRCHEIGEACWVSISTETFADTYSCCSLYEFPGCYRLHTHVRSRTCIMKSPERAPLNLWHSLFDITIELTASDSGTLKITSK